MEKAIDDNFRIIDQKINNIRKSLKETSSEILVNFSVNQRITPKIQRIGIKYSEKSISQSLRFALVPLIG